MCRRTVLFASGFFSLLLVVCACSEPPACLNGGKMAPTAKMEALPVNQIIVKYKSSTNLASAAAAGNSAHMQQLSDAAGVPLVFIRSMSGEAYVLRLPQSMEISRVLEICARIAALSDVEYAEPDYIMRATGNNGEGASVNQNGPQNPDQ